MTNMRSRTRRIVSVALLALGVASPALAQQIEIRKTPPDERPRIIPPPGLHDITRPRESDFYPDDIRVRHDPAFIMPLAVKKEGARNSALQYGLSGWTSPNTPAGQAPGVVREVPGWFALGFSIVWDSPAPVAPNR
jgi:hypothetical protein